MYFPPETRVSSQTTIQRERALKLPGEVTVQVGQRVEPWDVVAQAAEPGGYHIVEIAQALRVEGSDVRPYLLEREGDNVKAGDPIAVRRGLFRRAVRSPVDGSIVAVGTGRVLVKADTVVTELRAGMRGRVVAVRRKRGVVIEIVGAIVQGTWGNGKEGHGVLKTLADSPHSVLTPEGIEAGIQGAVVVAGQGMTPETLELAQEMQVRGVIVGSLAPSLFQAANAIEFPIVLTEGWGTIPMSSIIFDVLGANDGREVSLHGRLGSGWARVRPEVIMPLPTREPPSEDAVASRPLEEGVTVRILRQPHMSATGTVVGLPPAPRKLASGVAFGGAEVELATGEKVFVPFANLELIR